MVPMETFVSMLLEPSRGSKSTTYFPERSQKRASSSSSLAIIPQCPLRSSTLMRTSFAKASSFCTSSPLNVRLAGVPEHPRQPGGAHALRDDADAERDVIEERCKFPRGARGRAHSGENVLAQRGADERAGGADGEGVVQAHPRLIEREVARRKRRRVTHG